MQTKKCLILIPVIIVSLTGCQLFTPALSELQVGTEIDDVTKQVTNPTDVIDRTSPIIYCSVFLQNAPAGTKLRTTWERDGRQVTDPIEIEAEGSRYGAFTLKKPPEGFRTGTYNVRIELVDTPVALEKSFEVE